MVTNANGSNVPWPTLAWLVLVTTTQPGSADLGQAILPLSRRVGHCFFSPEYVPPPHQQAQSGVHRLDLGGTLVHHLLNVRFGKFEVETHVLTPVLRRRLPFGSHGWFKGLFGDLVVPKVHTVDCEPPDAIILVLFLQRRHLRTVAIEDFPHARGKRTQL